VQNRLLMPDENSDFSVDNLTLKTRLDREEIKNIKWT